MTMSTTTITNHLDSLDREACSEIEEETSSLQRQIILRDFWTNSIAGGSRDPYPYPFSPVTGQRHAVIFEHGGEDVAAV